MEEDVELRAGGRTSSSRKDPEACHRARGVIKLWRENCEREGGRRNAGGGGTAGGSKSEAPCSRALGGQGWGRTRRN